jgi:hypothetical protein
VRGRSVLRNYFALVNVIAGRAVYHSREAKFGGTGMPNTDETPLKERFEAASKEFATTFSRKARNARAGIETSIPIPKSTKTYTPPPRATGFLSKPCGPTSGRFMALTKSMALANVSGRTTP